MLDLSSLFSLDEAKRNQDYDFLWLPAIGAFAGQSLVNMAQEAAQKQPQTQHESKQFDEMQNAFQQELLQSELDEVEADWYDNLALGEVFDQAQSYQQNKPWSQPPPAFGAVAVLAFQVLRRSRLKSLRLLPLKLRPLPNAICSMR